MPRSWTARPLLGAFNTELFPTGMRADAYAWANNGIGRVAYVLSPVLVALAAESIGLGAAVRATAAFPLLALVLILLGLPETAGRELEETSALAPRRCYQRTDCSRPSCPQSSSGHPGGGAVWIPA